MKTICKVCKEPFDSFVELKSHFAAAHSQDYAKVERWVDETTGAKVRSYEYLAAEGMLGAVDPTCNRKSNIGNR